ncbi:UDP-glycosyltransferase 90A1-like [Cucumis melo]|uniref:Glycosyltransferase n=1 Tax=Cucumis melo TaxID=3656 RepID=A0A1S3C916_CUCME|nr:UDP-glycosyltransferase 90A1-like [Cucumis melo]
MNFHYIPRNPKNLVMDSHSQSPHHIVIFPFMAKGHTIPLLHLLSHLRRRFPLVSLTLFTTAACRPFISQFLSDSATDSVSIIDLYFPQNALDGLPTCVDRPDTLPTELWAATELMQPEFEKRLQSLPVPVTFLISDMFFWWTIESASKFGIPRIIFNGMSNYTCTITPAVVKSRVFAGVQSEDELVTVPDFPWVKITRRELNPVFWPEADPSSHQFQFIMKLLIPPIKSYGLIVNSFDELEPMFSGYMRNSERIWNIGPLCLHKYSFDPTTQKLQMQQSTDRPKWFEWLEEKHKQGEGVLYIAFGSMGEISSEQMKEIEIGLEESGVNFLWAKREEIKEMEDKGFEERVKDRGIIVREWVNQWEILKHGAVKGFFSHCGWNSVMESLSCGVPMLTYPLMAEQGLNARMVVDELRAGMSTVEETTSSMKGLVKGKDLKRCVRELMEGEKGKEVREKAMEISEMAKKAMTENGSSWRNLELLMQEMCNNKSSLLMHTELLPLNGRGVNYA